ITANEGGETAVNGTGERLDTTPEQTVMHDEEIHPARDRLIEGEKASVHRCADFGYAAIIGHLEPVVGTGIIFERSASGAFVAKGGDFVKGGHEEENRFGNYVR